MPEISHGCFCQVEICQNQELVIDGDLVDDGIFQPKSVLMKDMIKVTLSSGSHKQIKVNLLPLTGLFKTEKFL